MLPFPETENVAETFPETAPVANPVFFRTYSRRTDSGRETWKQVCDRTVAGLAKLGQLTPDEVSLLYQMQRKLISLSSGRWLWLGGTEWIEEPENFYGGYNCSSTNIIDWRSFGLLMDLAMVGCGTGAVLEEQYINQLPIIRNQLNIKLQGQIGLTPPNRRREETEIIIDGSNVVIYVGDSRQGWVKSYQTLLELSSDPRFDGEIQVIVDLSDVRPAGEPLKGFGGVANPIKLPQLYERVASILNQAVGRQLTSVECCLIVDEAAITIVSGNIRRCLPENTLVDTDKGLVAIQDIQIGDRVLTSQGFYPVVNSFFQGEQEIWAIHTDGYGTLECTANHKVAVATKSGYEMVKTYLLKPGDRLVTVKQLSDEIEIGSVEIEEIIQKVRHAPTYDLEVETVHEFVCNGGLLVSNSAGMRQGSSKDELFANAKMNLWQQDEAGNWRIDPKRDALRMANHSRVFHHKPTPEECIEAVRKQYYSGEGAIQWAGEAVARANCDLLNTPEKKKRFLQQYAYSRNHAEIELQSLMPAPFTQKELIYRMNIFGLNPCGEVILENNFCNLAEIHLNQIDPSDEQQQIDAFTAGALSASVLLHHQFPEKRYQYSREIDPIVGVSFTGLFDFFVKAFGIDWLKWWEAGRPKEWGITGKTTQYYLSDYFKQKEAEYLNRWRDIVHRKVWDYCDRHNLRRPNRCTTVQPAGTKSLLTGASPGWHPPKAQRFIRRVTFAKNDPVALACIDYGYNVVPSQSDKDRNGNLLNDPFSELCSEWLVEIPVAVPWADLPGADEIDISKFSALAQMDFYLNVQENYTTHNTSATIEVRSHEIEALGHRIYQAIQNDEGYISAALLARYDDLETYPRLPFQPIDKAEYDRLMLEIQQRRITSDFQGALAKYDFGEQFESGPAPCDSDKCLLPES